MRALCSLDLCNVMFNVYLLCFDPFYRSLLAAVASDAAAAATAAIAGDKVTVVIVSACCSYSRYEIHLFRLEKSNAHDCMYDLCVSVYACVRVFCMAQCINIQPCTYICSPHDFPAAYTHAKRSVLFYYFDCLF